MRRWIVLSAGFFFGLFACESPTVVPSPPPPRWVYAPAPTHVTASRLLGTLGRGQAPGASASMGIRGDHKLPLRLPTIWAVPGDGPARAIAYGLEGDGPAVELIEIDAGRVVWRDSRNCAGPIVGVTATTIVCADAKGTRAIDVRDGSAKWETSEPFLAIDGDRVTIAGVGTATIRDVNEGDELGYVKLPAGVLGTSIVASCGPLGRELFAIGQDGALQRIIEVGAVVKPAWATAIGPLGKLEACEGTSIVIGHGSELQAIARETGKVTGKLVGVRGWWPARDGTQRLEVATATGVAIWDRELVGPPEATALPALGELLATRGDRRLVRTTPLTAAVIDRGGVRAVVPFGELGGALGETALVAATWQGSFGETVHRRALPAGRRGGPVRVPPRPPGTAVTAELRDLPPVMTLDVSTVIARPATGMHTVGAVTLDPVDPAALYAVPLEGQPDETRGAGIARADLAAGVWRWHRADGCGPGTPTAIAITRDAIACGARGSRPGTASVRATSKTGAARWEWRGDHLDAIAGAGEVVLVYDADRMVALDARDGGVLAWFASGDGGMVRAAVLQRGESTLLVTYEQGAIVARVPLAGMLPIWSIAVAGVVRALSPSQDGILVELEDGDAFRIDSRGGAVTALPGLGLTWQAAGELVTGQAAGGLLYAPRTAVAPVRPIRPIRPPVRRPPVPIAPRETAGPAMSTPEPMPAPIGAAWQYTLYELGGGLRARNDYALAPPFVPSLARAAGAPLVVAYGPGLREAIVIDPRRGDPLRRVSLPDDAPPGLVFATIVDGQVRVGTLLAAPLRVAWF